MKKIKKPIIKSTILSIVCLSIVMIYNYLMWFFLRDELSNSWLITVDYVIELFSTITFQLRIYWTGKDKINLASVIGSLSWFVAIFSSIIGMFMTWSWNVPALDDDLINMLIFSPAVIIATFQGIQLIYYYDKKEGKNEKK